MLGRVLHPQLMDNLSMGLVARFNIKHDVKDVVKFIKRFGLEDDQDGEWIPSGFPIGKVQSPEHFEEIKKKHLAEGTFFNVTTGKTIGAGKATMVYGEGWAVKRNSPEHQILLKIISKDEEDDEEEIEIDETNGWATIKGSNYIWCMKRRAIVGRLLNNNKPIMLSQKAIIAIKASSKIKWEKISDEELAKCCLPRATHDVE